MNYFELLNLPPTFTLDEATLKQRYFELQREYHPDKAGLAGAQKSMELNQAYQILKDPIKRGQYLLSLHGVEVGHDNSTSVKPSMELLEEMMEKREAVMELESAEEAQALLKQAAEEFAAELERFAKLFEGAQERSSPCRGEVRRGARLDPDSPRPHPGPPPIGEGEENAAQSLLRLQYLAKWQAEIKTQAKKYA